MTSAEKLGVAVLTLGAFVTAASFCGSLWWRFELLSHFRVHFAWGFVLLTLLLLLTRSWKVVLGGALLAVTHAAWVLPVYSAPARAAATSATGARLRVVFSNVHTANVDHDGVLAFLRAQDADYIVVSEVDIRWIEALRPLSETHPTMIARPRPDNFGIALFSKHPLVGAIESIGGSDAPPTIIAHDASHRFTLMGTHPVPPVSHAYASARDRQILGLASRVAATDGPVLLIGDLNMTPWSPSFADLTEATTLHDSRKGFGVQTTWPASLPAPLRIPIDHCLATSHILILARRVGEDVGSDHLPIIVDFAVSP